MEDTFWNVTQEFKENIKIWIKFIAFMEFSLIFLFVILLDFPGRFYLNILVSLMGRFSEFIVEMVSVSKILKLSIKKNKV